VEKKLNPFFTPKILHFLHHFVLHQTFCISFNKKICIFTPYILHFFTQKNCIFTPTILHFTPIFYTKILHFLHQKFYFFYTNFFTPIFFTPIFLLFIPIFFLHQYFSHQYFCFLYQYFFYTKF